MKGKIDKEGNLLIDRKGTLKYVQCPFDFPSKCGDWCAKFKEPNKYRDREKVENTVLRICHGQELYFDEFEDERV